MKLFDYVKKQQTGTVVICVPCRDTVHSLFAYNLIQLINHCNHVGIKTHLIMETGSLISKQRQQLAEEALKFDAEYILWLDSDMSFPPNALETLLRHNQPVVACNYCTRSSPLKGVAYSSIGNWDSWIDSNGIGDDTSLVEGVGMGCMLVKSSVFHRMEKPWFEIKYHKEFNDHIGEDFYFCTKIRELGHDIVIDNNLSRELKHLGTTGFDLSRAIKQTK